MKRSRWLFALVSAVALTWTVATQSAAQSSVPNGVFVRNSAGFIWLVQDGQRVRIPIWTATDDEINALPDPDRWAVANDAGAIVAGDRPVWLTPAPTAPAPQPAVASNVVTLSGDGQLKTRPFDLTAGAYAVKWSGSTKTQFGGNLIMTLKRTDGQFFQESICNLILGKDLPQSSGETQVYGVKAGAHYLDILAPGPWSVTISPQ